MNAERQWQYWQGLADRQRAPPHANEATHVFAHGHDLTDPIARGERRRQGWQLHAQASR